MNAIEMMNEEHRNIKIMLKIVRKACLKIMNGDAVNFEDMDEIVYFISNYADSHHHKKEEKLLFNQMVEHIGEAAEKVINHGMLVEHEFGRLYVRDLKESLAKVKAGDEEAKLDVIANAISYTHLLDRHIDKEDNVIYKFAERELEDSILDLVNRQCKDYESNNENTRDKCLEILHRLEKKYL